MGLLIGRSSGYPELPGDLDLIVFDDPYSALPCRVIFIPFC